jgi:nitroreductase
MPKYNKKNRIRKKVIFMEKTEFYPLSNYDEYPLTEMEKRSEEFYLEMKKRRTVRQFSNRPVPRMIIENCIRAAGTAPSGANMQPWSFVVVSDSEVKRQIRKEAEKAEGEFYHKKSNRKWQEDLKPLGTNEQKPFLEIAPYLIVIFAQTYDLLPDGTKRSHYYVNESVGISTGILLSALHHTGLACLTYTPSRMGFLNHLLSRPSNERPFLIMVVGYPDKDAVIPKIGKKSPEDIIKFV